MSARPFQHSRQRHLLSLLPYLKKYRKQLLAGSLVVLLTNLAAIVSPWILRYAIDDLNVELARSKLAFYSSLLVAASLVEGVFRFLMRRIMIGISRRIEFDLRNRIFEHLQSLTPGFFGQNSTGDLMARATNDLNAVRSVLGPGIMYSLNTLFTSLFTASLLVSIEPTLALITLAPLAVVSLTVKYVGKVIHQRFERIQEQFAQLTTLAQENIAGIRVVKAYVQEGAFVKRFEQANQEFVSRSLALAKVQAFFNPALVALLGLSSLGVLWYGGRLVIQNDITLGDLVAFMAYLVMLIWPTIALGWVINVMERGSASMGRINAIFETEPAITVQSPRRMDSIRGDIEIRNLDFSYNGKPVLQEVSFAIRAGEVLAIVGKTGSGKTTLANLLCHLYPVPRNRIFIDQTDINDIDLSVLRKNIGYVPQDSFLFSESIRQNIAMGKPSASDAEVAAAAQVSNVYPDIVGFPNQFQTRVGERGITLSGGQKQRVTISRALLIDPRILILDDALSSVDTYTEEQILAGLSTEMKGRSVVLISHRISTVKLADLILVLDAGRVVERGTHDELLTLQGHYARLHEQQLLREELGIE